MTLSRESKDNLFCIVYIDILFLSFSSGQEVVKIMIHRLIDKVNNNLFMVSIIRRAKFITRIQNLREYIISLIWQYVSIITCRKYILRWTHIEHLISCLIFNNKIPEKCSIMITYEPTVFWIIKIHLNIMSLWRVKGINRHVESFFCKNIVHHTITI